MHKKYNADDLVFANLEIKFKGQTRKTEKYVFIQKYSKILDMPIYKGLLTKKKYVNHIYAHYAKDFYLTNIEKYTTYFPEDSGKKIDEETVIMKTRKIKDRELNIGKKKNLNHDIVTKGNEKQTSKDPKKGYINKMFQNYKRKLNKIYDSKKLKCFFKVYEINQAENEIDQEILNYCVSMNEKTRKINSENNKTKVIGTLGQEKKEPLNIQLSRSELQTLLNGETVIINAVGKVKVNMKEDIYSLLDKNPGALKENSRKNKSMIKKIGRIK